MSASRQRFRTSSGIAVSDSDSVIDVRDFPSFRARSSCVWPHFSASCWSASASSNAVRSLRCRFSTSASLHHFGVVHFADDHRDFAQADLHGGVIAAFAGDDLVTVPALPHDERFDDPFFGDRRHQLRQVAHHLAGLVRIRDRAGRWPPCGPRAPPPKPPELRRSARRGAFSAFQAVLASARSMTSSQRL